MKDLIRLPLVLLLLSGVLSACSDDNDDHGMDKPQMMDFQITVHNLSANQPLTPLAAILHQPGYSPWALGNPASNGLEQLAEGGDTAAFINAADADNMVYATATGSAVLLPGNSTSINISAMASHDMSLSIASMLANTNDAFTGVTGLDLSGMSAGQSKSVMLKVMDAGTEANSEAAGTIPGPADSGNGYDMARDDVMDKVHIHAGVVTMDDDLSSSVLDESHRWNGPAAKLVITRL